MAFCKTLYKNSAVRDISHKITGATGILLFYTWLKTKTLKIQPNKNNNLCSCSAIELMGKEVIESAKSVVVKKAQKEITDTEVTVNDKISKLEEKQDQIQDQILNLSAKLDKIVFMLSKN